MGWPRLSVVAVNAAVAAYHVSSTLVAMVACVVVLGTWWTATMRSSMCVPAVASANIAGEPTPKSFAEISDVILKGVDYIVNLLHDKKNGLPSRIGSIEVI